MPQGETALSKLVMEYLVTECRGSGDLEVFDALDFCDFFEKKYPETDDRNSLKARFLELRQFVQRAEPGWNAPSYINHVVAPDATTNPRFILAPWQVGLTEDHSVKGKSKMCYIFDTAHRFLLKPYSSRKDPIHVLFSPLAVTGQEVADWSMVIDVGMCKFSAVRMILECLVTLRQRAAVSEAHIIECLAQVRALFQVEAVYDPATGDAESQLKKTMSTKQVFVDRPRPDPLMWGKQWCKIISAKGLVYAAVIDAKIDEHNPDPDELIRFNDYEKSFMRLFPFVLQKTITLMEYHFQQFKMAESALPLKVWMIPDLNPDTKPTRAAKGPLWQQIRSPGKEALQEILHMWVEREIYTFLRNMKDWKRKNPKKLLILSSKAKDLLWGTHMCVGRQS